MMSGGAGAARGGARGGLGQFFGRGGLGAQQRLPPTSDYSSEPHPHSTRGTQAMRGELWFVPAGGAAKDKKKVWCVVQDGRFTIYTSFSNQNHLVADLKFTSIHRAFHFHHTVGRERMFFFGIDVVGMKFERLVFATDAEADFNMWSHFLSQFKTLESGIQPTRSRSGSHGPERDTTVHGDDADRADADDEGEAANASERQFFRDEISRLTSTCQEWQQRANGLRCAVEDALGMARGDPDSWTDTVGRLRGEIESRLASIAKAPTAATKALSAMATAFSSTLSAKTDATIDATATVGANLQREMVRLRSDVAEAHAKLALSASPTRRAMTPSGAAGTDTILDAAVEGGVLDARTRELDPTGAVAAVAASLRNTGRATGGAKDTPAMAAAAAADVKRLKNENDRLRDELASQRSALDAAVGGGAADGTTGGGAGQIIRGSMTLLGVRRHSNQFALGMAEDFLRTMTTARDLVVQLQRTLDTRARLGVRGREDVDRKQQSASLASREAALNDLEYVKTQRDHIRSAPQFAGLPDDLWNENWHIEVLKAVSAAEARALIAQERERDAATEAQQEANRQRSAFEQTSREQRRRLTTMIDDLTRTCQQRDEEIARMKDQFSDLKLIWAAESQILQSKLQHVRRGGAAAGGGAGATQDHDSIDGHPLTPLVLPKLSAAAVVQVLSGKESLDAAAEDLNRFLLWGATHVLPLCDGPAEDRPLLAIIQSVFDAQRALSRCDAHGPLHISADEWDETAARLDHLFSLAGIPFCVSHDERLAAIEDITDRIRAADDLALPPLTRDSAAFTDDESIAVLLEKSHPTPNEIALSEMVRAKTVEAQHWFDELQRSRRDVDALISQLQRIPRRSTEDIAAERAKLTEPLRKAVRQTHATLRFSTWTRWIARIRDLRSRRRVAEAFMQATTHGRQRLAFRAWLGLVHARLAMRKRRSRSELLVTRTSEGLRRIMFRRWQLFAQDAMTRRGKREAAHRAAYVFATKTSETQRRRFAWQTWARWAAQRRGHRAKLNAMSVFVSTTDRGLRHLCFSRWQRHAQTNQRRRILDKLSALGAAQIDRVRVITAYRKLALYAHQATGKRWARRRDDFIARTLCEGAKERFGRRYLQRWRQVVGKLRLRTHERTTRLTQLERSTAERTRRVAFSAWTRWVARIRDLRSRRRVAEAFMQATTHGRQRLAFRAWLGLVHARLAMRKRRSRSELLVTRTSEGLRRIMFRRWQLFAQDALTRRGKREAAHRAAYVFATKTSETQRRRFAWQTWARWAAQRRGHRAKLNAMSVFVSTTDRGLRHLCFSRWQRHAQTNQRRRILDKLSALGAAQIDRVRVITAYRKLALYAHQATGKRWARRRDDFIARTLCEGAKERFGRRYLQRWRQVVGKLRLRTHERTTRLTQLERSTAERTRRVAFSAWTRWVARIRDLRSRRRVAEAFMQATTHGRQRLAFRAWLGLVHARLAMRKRRSRSELLVTRTSEGLRRIMFRRWQLFAQDALTRRGKREAAHRAAYVFATKTSETQRRRFAWQTWARWAAQRRGHRAKLNAMSVFVSTTDRGLRHLCFSRWQRHAQTNQRRRILDKLSALGAAQIDRVRVITAYRKLALYAHQATGKRWARRRDDFIARTLCEGAKERFGRRYLQRWRQVVGKLRLRTHERTTRLTQLERSTAERTRRVAFSAWTRWVARIRDLRSRRRVAEAFMQATTHGRQRLAFRAWLGLVHARLAMRKRRSRSELLVTRTSEGLRRIMFRRWQLFAQDALTRRGKREAAHRAAFVFATKTSETQRRRFAWQTWARWAAQRRGHRAKLNAMSVFVSTTDRGLRHLCFSRWQRHAQTNQRQRLLNQANEAAMSVANATNVGDRLALSLLEAGVRRTLITDTLVQRQASWLELVSPTANAALESAAVIGCSVAALPQTTSELKHDLDDLNNGVAAACHILETSSVHGGAKRSVAVLCSAVKKNVEALVKSQEVLHSATAEIAAAPPTVRRDDLASGIADLVALCKAKDAEVAATKRTSEEQQRTIEQLRSELGEGASQTDTLGQALAALQAAAQSACNTLEPTATPTRGKPVEPKQLTAAAQRAREALTSTEAQLEEARSEVEQERKRLEQLRDDIAAVEGVLVPHASTLAWARESSPSAVDASRTRSRRRSGRWVRRARRWKSCRRPPRRSKLRRPRSRQRLQRFGVMTLLRASRTSSRCARRRTLRLPRRSARARSSSERSSSCGASWAKAHRRRTRWGKLSRPSRRRRRAHATRWNRRPRRRAGSRSSRSS
jgi:hypothetical protein